MNSNAGLITIVIVIIIVVIVAAVIGFLLLFNSGKKNVLPIAQPTVISQPGTPPVLSAPYVPPPPPPAEPVLNQNLIPQAVPQSPVDTPNIFRCLDQGDCPEDQFCANGECVSF